MSSPHSLIKNYNQNKPKFNGVYLKKYFNQNKGQGIYNKSEYKLTGTHWGTLYVNGNNVTYFDHELNNFKKELKNP